MIRFEIVVNQHYDNLFSDPKMYALKINEDVVIWSLAVEQFYAVVGVREMVKVCWHHQPVQLGDPGGQHEYEKVSD